MTHVDYKFSSILKTEDKTVVKGYFCEGEYRKGDKTKNEDETKDYYKRTKRFREFEFTLPAGADDFAIKNKAKSLLEKDKGTKQIIKECL